MRGVQLDKKNFAENPERPAPGRFRVFDPKWSPTLPFWDHHGSTWNRSGWLLGVQYGSPRIETLVSRRSPCHQNDPCHDPPRTTPIEPRSAHLQRLPSNPTSRADDPTSTPSPLATPPDAIRSMRLAHRPPPPTPPPAAPIPPLPPLPPASIPVPPHPVVPTMCVNDAGGVRSSTVLLPPGDPSARPPPPSAASHPAPSATPPCSALPLPTLTPWRVGSMSILAYEWCGSMRCLLVQPCGRRHPWKTACRAPVSPMTPTPRSPT